MGCFVRRVKDDSSGLENIVPLINFLCLFCQCGIILGPLLMITSGFLTKCSCELLLKGAQVARKRSYELLGEMIKHNSQELSHYVVM